MTATTNPGNNLENLDPMINERTRFARNAEIDFLIIGAGAAGGVIARELSAAGFRIVVLEQGPYMKESDFEHDEM